MDSSELDNKVSAVIDLLLKKKLAPEVANAFANLAREKTRNKKIHIEVLRLSGKAPGKTILKYFGEALNEHRN